MHKQSDLREEMSSVRNRGLANASVLGERVEKLSDWREHVKAHPLPIALAVGAIAYWAVPAKRTAAPVSASPTPISALTGQNAKPGAAMVKTEREAKVAGVGGMVGVAVGFVGSLIGNAIRSYVSEQVQTLITSRGNHATSQQRQTPFSDS